MLFGAPFSLSDRSADDPNTFVYDDEKAAVYHEYYVEKESKLAAKFCENSLILKTVAKRLRGPRLTKTRIFSDVCWTEHLSVDMP